MTLSFNEVSALALTAARGCGYSWGLAEDAAHAVRWVEAYGLPGCAALASLLRRVDSNVAAYRPDISRPVWSTPEGVVCPLAAGTTLADRAAFLAPLETRMNNVISPLLLLPFAADAAISQSDSVEVRCGGRSLTTDGQNVAGDAFYSTGDVRIEFGVWPVGSLAKRTRVAPEERDLDTLRTFAARTYAPATAASRRTGAGSSLSDND